jgi:hypothetical protein
MKKQNILFLLQVGQNAFLPQRMCDGQEIQFDPSRAKARERQPGQESCSA